MSECDPGREKASKRISGIPWQNGSSSIFIDVESCVEQSGTESNCNSFHNLEEALVVLTIIKNLSEAGILGEDIGVISPYQAHKDLIVNMLPSYARGVEIANVRQQYIGLRSQRFFQSTVNAQFEGT